MDGAGGWPGVDAGHRGMVNIATIRAPLFVPANRSERFAKAAASGADAIILDLEDAVAPADKQLARANLCCDFTDLPVIVRINAVDSIWHDADVAAVQALPLAAVLLPKSEDPEVLAGLVRTLAGAGAVLALVETARGLAMARHLAAVPGVARLVFGSVDFCADLGMAHLPELLLPARSEIVLASRLAAISPPIDGVTVQLNDLSETESDARHARDLGMTGKLCIHPKQIAPVQQAFRPSAQAVAWAKRVIAALDASGGGGAVALDGEMVDAPVKLRAQAILAARLS